MFLVGQVAYPIYPRDLVFGILPFAILAFLRATDGERRWAGWALLAGVLLGVCGLIQVQLLLPIPVALATLAVARAWRDRSRWTAAIGALVADRVRDALPARRAVARLAGRDDPAERRLLDRLVGGPAAGPDRVLGLPDPVRADPAAGGRRGRRRPAVPAPAGRPASERRARSLGATPARGRPAPGRLVGRAVDPGGPLPAELAARGRPPPAAAVAGRQPAGSHPGRDRARGAGRGDRRRRRARGSGVPCRWSSPSCWSPCVPATVATTRLLAIDLDRARLRPPPARTATACRTFDALLDDHAAAPDRPDLRGLVVAGLVRDRGGTVAVVPPGLREARLRPRRCSPVTARPSAGPTWPTRFRGDPAVLVATADRYGADRIVLARRGADARARQPAGRPGGRRRRRDRHDPGPSRATAGMPSCSSRGRRCRSRSPTSGPDRPRDPAPDARAAAPGHRRRSRFRRPRRRHRPSDLDRRRPEPRRPTSRVVTARRSTCPPARRCASRRSTRSPSSR